MKTLRRRNETLPSDVQSLPIAEKGIKMLAVVLRFAAADSLNANADFAIAAAEFRFAKKRDFTANDVPSQRSITFPLKEIRINGARVLG